MTTFKQYINEKLGDGYQKLMDTEFEETWSKIEKECRPFLKNIFGKNIVFRGYKSSQNIIKKTSRTDRRPRVISDWYHKGLDKIFYDIFGWKVRSEGVFTGDERTSSSWGNMYAFFPIGPYKYVWSGNYMRLWDKLSDSEYIYDDDENKKEMDSYIRSTKPIIKRYYDDKGLEQDHVTYEAIFKCKGYYMIDWINNEKNLKEKQKLKY